MGVEFQHANSARGCLGGIAILFIILCIPPAFFTYQYYFPPPPKTAFEKHCIENLARYSSKKDPKCFNRSHSLEDYSWALGGVLLLLLLFGGSVLGDWSRNHATIRVVADAPQPMLPHGHGSAPVEQACVSPWQVLGISDGASFEDVQKAYVGRMQQLHPARMGEMGEEFRMLAEQRSQTLNEAFHMLKRIYGVS